MYHERSQNIHKNRGGGGRKSWIDCAKLIAILAVIVDHTFQVLYTNKIISVLSYFSVVVFIFLSGVTSFYSWEKQGSNLLEPKITWGKIRKILVPYAVATMLYLIVSTHYIDIRKYLYYLINFNISSPFYFVFVYMQLTLISPLLFWLIRRTRKENLFKKNLELVQISIIILLIALFSVRFTSFSLDIYIGGQNMFGGTYLFIFFLGMIFAEHNHRFQSAIINFIYCIIFTIIWIGVGLFLWSNQFQIEQYFPFGEGINPPGLSLMLYGLTTAMMLYCWFSLFENVNNKYINIFIQSAAKLGKYSLYIFLYHRLLLDYMLPYFNLEDKWLQRIVYISAMVGVPVLGAWLWSFIKNYWIILDRR